MRFNQNHTVVLGSFAAFLALTFVLLVVRCTTLAVVEQRTIASIKNVLSDASMQLLVDIGTQLQSGAKIGDLVNKFADADLGLLKRELLAVNKVAKDLGIPLERTIELTPDQQQQVRSIIQDAQAHWTNRFGWIELTGPLGPQASYDNDNPALYTGLYLWLLWRLQMLNGPVQDQYFSAIQAQQAKNQLQPGLYDRVPVSLRTPNGFVMNFSHDESLGLLLLDFIFDYKLGFAKDQRTFGDAHGYNFPNAAWKAVNTFTRPVYNRAGNLVPPYDLFLQTQFYGAQVEDIRRAGGITPTFGSDLILCAGLISMLSNDAVDAILSASIHKGESDALDGCIYQFNALLKAKYPVGGKVGDYVITSPVPLVTLLGGLNQQHPSARLVQFLTE